MHYIPYDYHRYTSFALKDLFSDYSYEIVPRGSDVTVIWHQKNHSCLSSQCPNDGTYPVMAIALVFYFNFFAFDSFMCIDVRTFLCFFILDPRKIHWVDDFL